ncbi:M23 family metallopeptidase [Luteimonas sp. MC1825]|uniref:M23 family metallopeptidase n=1 Tax=Luteimonas sp. MC1825 TaxID=2761107 RepID=UPI001CC6C619|nr:M23 family metallopeptidase [Luteimonas sp. MC1825]
MLAVAHWCWRQPFMAKPRTLWELSRMPAPEALAMPVAGVRAAQVADTFGAARGSDRTHAGVDIFAPRGTPVASATRGIVSSVREGGLGGRQVWVLGPARQRHYYAHLDDWASGLAEGDVLAAGSVIGHVGDTGNARGTPPHLHYGVYGSGGAIDPLPLLQAGDGKKQAPRAR